MLKRLFDLIVKQHWLKIIDKECAKYNKLKRKLDIQQFIVNDLLEEYRNIYGEDFGKKELVGEDK